MNEALVFDPELITRYDRAGPRYTSYPTALQFSELHEAEYQAWVQDSNEEPLPRPISLYFHLPYCSRICYYCACTKIVTANRAHAVPYLGHLKQEIALQGRLFDRDRKVTQLHWGGGTPTFFNPEQMRDLMRTTAEHFHLSEEKNREYSIEVDPREANEFTVGVLRELGFNRISLGVQDFDLEVQRAVNRVQSEEQTEQILVAARSNDFHSVSMDLIYGLPLQTLESFMVTLDKVIAMAPDRLSVFNYAHLPTRFKSQKQIKTAELPSVEEKLRILQGTIERLGEAGYVFIGMDHFARPDDELCKAQQRGSLHRNFQGYSTHAECDLVGMGMSAIGSIGGNYAQNEREAGAYSQAIGEGRLAVFRGLAPEPEDRLRREVITQLICHFELDPAAFEARWKLDFWEHFSAERVALQEMMDDGLLSLTEGVIHVLPPGRLLVRNICMVFDRHLPAHAAGGAYSRAI